MLVLGFGFDSEPAKSRAQRDEEGGLEKPGVFSYSRFLSC